MMKAQTRDPGDFGVAYGTGPALELPEKAKSPRTPKRFRHMICFAFFEVGIIDGIVRISGALDLDVPLNGRATGEAQSHFVRFALVVTLLPEEGTSSKAIPCCSGQTRVNAEILGDLAESLISCPKKRGAG